MQLDYLIRELTRLKNFLPSESEVRIGATGWGNHTYELNEIRFTPIPPLEEPEHTCEEPCICTAELCGEDQHFTPLDSCPSCNCIGCEDEDVDDLNPVTIYFIQGDQDPYSLPETIDEDELKQRLGEN